MAFQPVADTALVQVQGVVDQQLTINDLSFQISGGGITPVNLQQLCIDVAGWVVDTLCPLLSDDWAATRVIGIDLGSATGARIEQSASQVGGVSGEANPNNVAACVSLRTAQRGRSARGRNYVPGIPGSVVTLNTIDDVFIADLLTAYNQLVGAGTFSAGWQLVVVSRATGGAPRVSGLAIPVVNCTMVGNSVRSMRSREIGHGA